MNAAGLPTGLITIRYQVTLDDSLRVRDISQSSGFFTADEVEIAVDLLLERLRHGPDSDYHFLFADLDGQTTGYVCFGQVAATVNSWDLYWIAVDDRRRGHGIGRRLLAETERAIAERGGGRLYIETSSQELYRPTRAFYLHHGYQELARLPDFYGPDDAKVIYARWLEPSRVPLPSTS